MARYVVAGKAGCPSFARAELLADDLSLNLPDFKVHKVRMSDNEWSAWLAKTCSQHGWTHDTSPLVWRELVDRGGEGTYLGGWEGFSKMVTHWYGYESKLDDKKVKEVAEENASTHTADGAADSAPPPVPTKITILGANERCAYLLAPQLLGSCFPLVALTLCDSADKQEGLQGIAMELTDCAFDDLASVTVTSDRGAAVKGADYVIVIDPLDAASHPDKFELLKAVNVIYKQLAGDLGNNLDPKCKVIISGYKGCVGGMMLLHHGLKVTNLSVVLSLDEQRMRAQLARKLAVLPEDLFNVVVWGNIPVHGRANTHIAALHNHQGAVDGPPSFSKPVQKAVNEASWEKDNVLSRQDRDKVLRGLSKAGPDCSNSWALFRHLKSLVEGSTDCTMGLISTGQYGTTPGTVFGFPVKVVEGEVSVREGEVLSDELKELITQQNNQLTVEKQVALGECDDIADAVRSLEQAMWDVLEQPKLKKKLEEAETARLAAEEATRKAAEAAAKAEAKKKAEEEEQRKQEEELAAADAAANFEDVEEDDDEEE